MKFCAASDQSLLVYLGDALSLATHERVLKLLRLLEKQPPPWLRNLQPAYASLMVTFDPCQVDHAAVEAALHQYHQRSVTVCLAKRRIIEIPVCYGHEFGPDLEDVARMHGFAAEQVVALHSSKLYHAYFLGFAPGFAYLGDLPEEMATPRLETPRKSVPPGSVGIAGRQTGVYPFATPGGWRLIGRTPLPIFRGNRQSMAAISIGDQVRFRPISRQEFSKRVKP